MSYHELKHSNFHYPETKNRTKLILNPNHITFSKYYDKYMILIALFGSIFIYLQAITIISNKSSENVSIPSYILFLIVSLSWLVYGVLWSDSLVVVSGLISTIGSIIALVASISYKSSSQPGPFTSFS